MERIKTSCKLSALVLGCMLSAILCLGVSVQTAHADDWSPDPVYSITKPVEISKATWVKSGNGWWLKKPDGSFPSNERVLFRNKIYFFDSNGWMKTGWQQIEGYWFYFGTTGSMVSGWKKIDSKWYYFGEALDGIMKTGKYSVKNKIYILGPDGDMKTGWYMYCDEWQFLDRRSGVMKTGWVKDAGNWYFLNSNGIMMTGWIEDKGKKYYLEEGSGIMQTSKWIDDCWVTRNGAMATNTYVDGYKIGKDGKWLVTVAPGSDIFHLKQCRSAKKIKNPTYIRPGEATAKGMIRCSICK